MSVVLDSSALLAMILNEEGADVAFANAKGGLVSAVSMTEVLEKAAERGVPPRAVFTQQDRLEIAVIPFDADHAMAAAALRPAARRLNISLADLACLSLALRDGRPVVTGDRDWLSLALELDIRLIR